MTDPQATARCPREPRYPFQLAALSGQRRTYEQYRNGKVKFIHCLPAINVPNTTVDHDIMVHSGMTGGPEVADEVFESAASIVFDQAGNRLHTMKAILVAMLGR